MKKSYFWGLLLAIMALIPSQALADYCKVTSSHSHSERHLDSFTITDGANSLSLTNVQPNKGSSYWPSYSIYFDKTESQLITTPGATLYFSQMTYPGSWTHGYVYIDYNSDETFDQVANNDGTTGGELVSYSAYKPADATDDIYYDVNGNVVAAGSGVSINTIPSWTLPADLAEGTYRLRFKIDWNNIDPCGAPDIATNGCGTIVDITLNVKKPTPERTISVTAIPAEAGTVSVNGNGTTATAGGQITLTAVPVSGYAFVNWTLNGVEVSTSSTFVDDTEGDKEYVANFAVDPKLDRSNWSIFTVSSAYQGLDGDKYVKGEQAIDNDPTSYWHSDWDNAANKTVPQWIVFDLGSVQKFTSFSYAARTAEARGANGAIKTYKLYVSETAPSLDNLTGSMTEVTSGEFIYPNATHMIDLGSEYSAQYVMLYATSTYGGTEPQDNQFANCAEFFLYYEGTTPAPTPVYAVSVATADEAMGTAEVSATEVEEGTEVTFTATAAEGYQFVNWTSGEEVVSTENPYTVAVTAEMALTANFELIPVTKYTVTVNAGVGGTAEASATEVEEGQTVTLTATAAEGYAFANWTSSAVEPVYYIQNYTSKKYLGYNTVNLAAIDEQTSDATIAPSTLNDGEFTIYLTNATYDQQTPPQQQSYLNCGSSGRFSGNCDNTFAAQQIAIFKVENPAAETITATKVTEVKAGETYMFVGLKDGAYYALTDEIYKENDATGQRMVGAEVTITDGTITYVPGTSSALWTLGNKAVASTENPYTVTVTADVEYTANFDEVPVVKYPVSVTTVDGAMGTAEVSATEVEEGDEVTFTATANLGYKFIGWLANGETVSTENPYTTAVTAEMSLVANFEEIALENEFVVTVDKVDQEWQFVVAAEDEDSKLIKVDWGNGELVSYEILSYWGSVSPWETTITGTPVGDGTVKVYAANLYKFDCSYNQNYGAKVTSVDLSKAGALKSFIASTNSLTSLDLTANAELTSVSVNGNSELSTIVWPSTNVLTTVDFSDCAFTALDLSACTSLTTLKVNNNTGMGGINVSANTALTSLYANNTGLTTIDLSANTKLKYLYVNDNQLTTVDVSNMVAGLYLYANNNQLTSIVAGESNVTSKSRIQILNNNFTLATLPAFTAITKIGTSGYNYAPQKAMTIAAEINEGEELDLSAQNNIVGRATEAQATVYTWYTADGTEFTNYTVEGGKFVFDVESDTELYCTMTSEAFSSFSGANALTTTNIVVKNLAPAIIVKHAEANIERQFTFDATEEGATIFIDWGDGNLQEYAIAYYDNWDAWETTINGTILGDGTVKIYGDQIHMFDCSYSSSYPVKVTEVNVANCPSLYEFSCYTNEITSLDLTSNAALVKVYVNGNPALNNIEFAAENAMTTLDLNDCAFTTLDLSSCTSLTSLSVNNNTGLGSLDVTALTALKTLNANNIGLTSIDLSANVKLATLRLNDNQLTSLNISACATNIYLWADNNNLTDLIVSEGLKASAKVSVKNNNFTLATLPALKVLTTDGTKYVYAPQKPLAIAAEINEGEELDLSAQNNIVGRATEAQATVYTWYTADGTEFTNYTVEGGKFVFNVTEDTELYCAMTTEAFPSFSGTNAFTTTNIVVKYVPVERKVQFKSSDIVMGTVQIISPSQGGTGTGGTGTGGTGTGGTGTSGTGTSGTGTSGTGTGSATSGGGQSPWVITTEDVTAQASVQGNAYEFVNWTIGEEIVGTELTYTYTGEEEALIQANFRQKDTYKTITIDVKPVVKDEFGTNLVGSVKFQGRSGKTAIIEQGSSLTAVATAKEGYEFSSWKDASTGEDVSFDAEYTFTVAADINLEAWFSELPVVTTCQVLVNIAPTEDYGTVVIEGVEGLLAEVEVGTEVTAVATPAEGKIFEGWFTFEGDELSTNATYTFTATEDVVVVAWFTDAPEAEYCTYEGNSTHSERRLNAVTITDGTNTTTVSSIQPYFRGAVYVDKTDVVFPTYAGATVDFSEFDFKGEWMHAYVYIDYDNDKVFNTTVNADGTTGGELVSFTFYSATDSGTGVNSLGETVSNYTIPMVNYLPAFTLPADLEDGEYRVRIKTDRSHLDPCGHPTESANKLTANGGCIADFTMSVSDFNGIESADADAVQVYAADGVIYINGYEGDVKVVNASGQVIKDVNVNGNDTLEVAAGLYMVVTGDQVTKVVVK